MSRFNIKEYIKGLLIESKQDDLIEMALNNKLSFKALRNEAIKRDFYNLYNTKPLMDIYYQLSIKYRVSEQNIMLIIRSRDYLKY